MKRAFMCLILAAATSTSSLGQGVFDNQISAALQKVIGDYPHRFENIRGKVVDQRSQTTDFQSTIEVPGSIQCTVSKYKSPEKDLYRWTCLLHSNSDFSNSKNKYKSLYNQIANAIIKLQDEKAFILNGKYDEPDEAQKISSVMFQLLPATGEMRNLKIELQLIHKLSGWDIRLMVYEQDSAADVAFSSASR
jgi:hypothetical protein